MKSMEPMESVDLDDDQENKTNTGDIIVVLKDGDNGNRNNHDDNTKSIEFGKTGTTIIRLESDKDLKHKQNKKNVNKDKKKGKELSRIPYKLENLASKKSMLDLLRETKLRDLFAVSYIARYIFCTIIGCISFLILAILWKYVFAINICRIEGDDRQFKYMPFAFGFMIAYQNGLLFVAPFLYLILPTVGVTHKHRTRFIIFSVIIIFILCTCYGFYGKSWSLYIYICLSFFGVLYIINFFYWGGYFAFWVMFPLLASAAAAFAIMAVFSEFVWSSFANDPFIFGLIYPFYLSFLEFITFKCMLWIRLPYKIRKFFVDCCPHFCCKSDENGETPRWYSNYDDFYFPDAYDLKYIQKRNSSKQMSTQFNTKRNSQNSVKKIQIDDNEDNEDNENADNENADNENADNEMDQNDAENQENHQKDETVINKSLSNHVSHKYKSTEWELTIEDVWSNDILFVAGGTVIVLIESMRVTGMVALKDDIGALILNIISSIILECLARNNLILEFLFRCVFKKDNPPLTRFYSTVIGTRYQTEYIPYFVITMMNFTQFGPTNECKAESLGYTVDIPFKEYWWFYIVLFLSETLSDLIADWIKKIGRKKGWIGDKEYGDPAREATYVKLRLWMMICCFIGFFSVSFSAYNIDFDAKKNFD